jgi:hypothetical protein
MTAERDRRPQILPRRNRRLRSASSTLHTESTAHFDQGRSLTSQAKGFPTVRGSRVAAHQAPAAPKILELRARRFSVHRSSHVIADSYSSPLARTSTAYTETPRSPPSAPPARIPAPSRRTTRHRLNYGRRPRRQPHAAHDRRLPPALLRPHPSLRRPPHQARQNQARDHPLPEALQRPPDIPRTTSRTQRATPAATTPPHRHHLRRWLHRPTPPPTRPLTSIATSRDRSPPTADRPQTTHQTAAIDPHHLPPPASLAARLPHQPARHSRPRRPGPMLASPATD